jgi:YD repeat-containing protein
MRKYIVLSLMSSVLFINSCESEDEIGSITDPVEQKILLSKVTTVYYDNPANPETTVSTLEYNNQGKLIKSVSAGRSSTVEYNTAGKPVKTNYYNTDGTIEYYSQYNYNGEELANVKAIYSNADLNRTINYTYNNGKVATSTLCQTADCSNPITSSYTYNGENITVETSETGGTFSSSSKREYLYDNQLNPFTFTNKYFRIMMGGAYAMSKNNYSSERISYKDSAGNWVQNQQVIYEIQYNSAQLPIQVIGKTTSGASYVKYNYEYIVQ